NARLHECFAVGVTAARVRIEHRVAAAGQDLELVKEGMTVCGVGPAMDLEDERPLLLLIEVARTKEPALDLPAIGPGELKALRDGDVALSEELVVEARRFAHRAADRSGSDVPRIGCGRENGREAAPRAVEGPGDHLMGA